MNNDDQRPDYPQYDEPRPPYGNYGEPRPPSYPQQVQQPAPVLDVRYFVRVVISVIVITLTLAALRACFS